MTDVFLSYAHADQRAVAALHYALARYRPPKGLHDMAGNPVPKTRRLTIHRDVTSMNNAPGLQEEINRTLNDSRFLAVVVSSRSLESTYVDGEIASFDAMGRWREILAVRAGQPQGWPPAMQRIFDREQLREPRFTDLGPDGAGFFARRAAIRRAVPELVAKVLQCDPRDVIRWEIERERRRRITWTAIWITIAIALAVACSLALTSYWRADRQLKRSVETVDQLQTLMRDELGDAPGAAVVLTYVLDLAAGLRTYVATDLPNDVSVERQAIGNLVKRAEFTTDAAIATTLADEALARARRLAVRSRGVDLVAETFVAALNASAAAAQRRHDSAAALARLGEAEQELLALSRRDPGNQLHRVNLASLMRQIASFQAQSDHTAAASTQARAEEIYRQAAAESGDPRFRYLLAKCRLEQGTLLLAGNDRQAAEAALREALALLDELRQDNAFGRRLVGTTIETLAQFAVAEMRDGRHAAARDWLRQSLALQSALLALAAPTSAERIEHANTLRDAAKVEVAANDLDAARALGAKELEAREAICAALPDDAAARHAATVSRLSLGMALSSCTGPDRDKARNHLVQALAEFPMSVGIAQRDPDGGGIVARAEWALARIEQERAGPAEALAHFHRAATLLRTVLTTERGKQHGHWRRQALEAGVEAAVAELGAGRANAAIVELAQVLQQDLDVGSLDDAKADHRLVRLVAHEQLFQLEVRTPTLDLPALAVLLKRFDGEFEAAAAVLGAQDERLRKLAGVHEQTLAGLAPRLRAAAAAPPAPGKQPSKEWDVALAELQAANSKGDWPRAEKAARCLLEIVSGCQNPPDSGGDDEALLAVAVPGSEPLN